MGLIEALARAASSRAHVLVAEAPGAFRERVALERALDRVGWCSAESVADADVLAVVGEPGASLAGVIEHVWAQMSEPRVRFQMCDEDGADAPLSQAREQLRQGAKRLTGPVLRRGFTPSADDMRQEHEDHDADADAGEDDHSAMMPDGISLAEGAQDRDGLEMDELHLPLGPVLAHWPAGVVLRLTLHGDVVADAVLEQLAMSGAVPGADDAIVRAARLLDAAGSVLALAGVGGMSARARRLRDRCLDGHLTDGVEVTALGERVARQRVLRWSLGGLTAMQTDGGSEHLHDRLTGLFERARAELDAEAPARAGPSPQSLPELVRGQELAAVRLWSAAWMPDLAGHELGEPAHG